MEAMHTACGHERCCIEAPHPSRDGGRTRGDRRGGDTGGRCTGGLCWRARVEEACCSADGACAAAGTNPVAPPQAGFAVGWVEVEVLGVAAAVGVGTAARGANARSNGERGGCDCGAGMGAAAAEDEGVLESVASAVRLRGSAPLLTKLKSPMDRRRAQSPPASTSTSVIVSFVPAVQCPWGGMSARAKRIRLDNKASAAPVDGPRVRAGDCAPTDAPEESAGTDGTRTAQRSSTTDAPDVARSPSAGGELPVGFEREPTWEETIHRVSSAIVVRCQPCAAWVLRPWLPITLSVSLVLPSAALVRFRCAG